MVASTNIQDRKIELIQWLSVIDDLRLLDRISELKEQSDEDWWDNLADAEKISIDKGLADAEQGKLRPHSEARKVYEKWL